MYIELTASLMCANYGHLEREITELDEGGIDSFHIDIMDGRYVPNFAMSLNDMKYIAGATKKPLDVHLMIVNPQNYISQVRDSGATIMNVHQEACVHLDRTVQAIKAAGMKAAVTLNPATPLVMLEDVIGDLDMVLLMSVNPGFGGQKFIANAVEKTRRLKAMIQNSGSKAIIEVDGGVNAETGKLLADAGADMVVAGNYVFAAPDPHEAIRTLKRL